MSRFVELMALRQYAEIKLNECDAAISKLDKISRTQLAKIEYKEGGKTKDQWIVCKKQYETDIENLDNLLDQIYFEWHIVNGYATL